MIGSTLEHYRIVNQLGVGGMGEVYLAEDLKLGRQIALKILPERFAASPERIERFRREAQALAALDHPGIVTVHSIESAPLVQESQSAAPIEVQFLTMQYVQGESLKAVVPRHGLPLSEFLKLAVPIADAISAAHEKGIVHRDLKPNNIMVTGDERVKILDFGLAKLLHPSRDRVMPEETTESLTGTDKMPGTLPYMSPEQIRGAPADHRSDIFSLGVVLYEMATGQYPFRRTSTADLASSILRDTPSSLSDIRAELPDQLGWILSLCLQKDPDKRMQSMKELRNELEYLDQEISALSVESPELIKARKRSRQLAWLLGAAGVVALVLGVLLVVNILGKEPVDSGPPRFLAVEPVPSFAGAGESYVPVGLARFLENRLQGLDGLYVIEPEGQSPLPDYRLEIDTRLEGGGVSFSYRLFDRQLDRSVGGEILRSSKEGLVDLADDVGEGVADLLRKEGLEAAEFQPLDPPTDDGEALDHLLQGLELLSEQGVATDLEGARREFAAAWSADSGFALAQAYNGLTLQRLYQESEDPEVLASSQELCSDAYEAEPQLPEALLCLAEASRLSGSPLEAASRYRQAIKLGIHQPQAYRGARSTFVDLGRPEQEEVFWTQVIAADPEYWLGYSSRAEFYLEQGEAEAALVDAQHALDLASNNPGVYLTLWYVQSEMGRHGEALLTLERALEVDEENYGVWGNLGTSYFQLRRFGEAINAHTRTIELAPEEYRAHGLLGRDLYWTPGTPGGSATSSGTSHRTGQSGSRG